MINKVTNVKAMQAVLWFLIPHIMYDRCVEFKAN